MFVCRWTGPWTNSEWSEVNTRNGFLICPVCIHYLRQMIPEKYMKLFMERKAVVLVDLLWCAHISYHVYDNFKTKYNQTGLVWLTLANSITVYWQVFQLRYTEQNRNKKANIFLDKSSHCPLGPHLVTFFSLFDYDTEYFTHKYISILLMLMKLKFILTEPF